MGLLAWTRERLIAPASSPALAPVTPSPTPLIAPVEQTAPDPGLTSPLPLIVPVEPIAPVPPVREGCVIWIRDSTGVLTTASVPEAKMRKVEIGGQGFEHVADAPDGTWGLNAENMAEVEPRLAFYEKEGPDIGKPRGVAYEETVALLTKAIQQLTGCVQSNDARACLLALETP